MKIGFLLIFIATVFSGCAAVTPNLLVAEMRGIDAKGTISKQREQVGLIEIDPRALSEAQLHDLWVGLASTNQTTFAEITEDLIKKIGIPSTNYYSAPTTKTTYYVCGYSFRFEGGQFVSFLANQYGFPPKKATAFVKLGSRKSDTSLSLPCSVDDFEKVFGKADKITRGFGW
jgi:hypothetical protein